jgi:energy-coupling factor transport system permease protein
MNSTGLYLPGASPLHRLHPLTKLVFTLAALAMIFGGPGRWAAVLLPGLAALALLRWGCLAGRAARAILRLLPLALVLFAVHGLFSPLNETILARLGPFSIGQEGMLYAALIAARLASALAASFVLVMSTSPADLVQALESAGMGRSLAYLLGSPLLLLPQLATRVHTIRAAQQSRGLETRGDFIQRLRALYPLAAPLIFSSLVDVEERSLALETRGFSAPGKRTSLKQLRDSHRQKTLRLLMAALAVLLPAVGLWERLHG